MALLAKLVPVGGDLSHPEVEGAGQWWKLAEENVFLCGGGAFKYPSEFVSYYSFVLFIHQ